MAELKLSGTEAEPKVRSVYIIGPMRGYHLFNFPAFDDAAFRGRRAGFNVISPAEKDRSNGIDPAANQQFTIEQVRGFAAQDLSAILELRAENFDAVALLPGWERSAMGMAEYMTAMAVGLDILDARTFEPFDHAGMAGIDWQGLGRRIGRTMVTSAQIQANRGEPKTQ